MSKETIKKENIIGIDLGTTNSCVAVRGKVILNDESNTTPSIVSFNEKGEKEAVGQEAKKQIIIKPELVVYEAKRLIGKKYSDPKVQEFCKVAPFQIFENKEKDGDA
jgi:molecular chaperone DnaK